MMKTIEQSGNREGGSEMPSGVVSMRCGRLGRREPTGHDPRSFRHGMKAGAVFVNIVVRFLTPSFDLFEAASEHVRSR